MALPSELCDEVLAYNVRCSCSFLDPSWTLFLLLAHWLGGGATLHGMASDQMYGEDLRAMDSRVPCLCSTFLVFPPGEGRFSPRFRRC